MFLRGFERDGAKTSGFFKLQKIRTGKNIILDSIVSSVFCKAEKLPGHPRVRCADCHF
jgi:hypothetical protein